MPRRKKPFLGPGVVLVDGGRYDLPDGAEKPITILQGVKGNAKTIRKQVNGHVQAFDELAQLPDRECFIDDLVTECLSAQRMRLDYLVKGRRTKPDEWTAQILVRGLATVMEKHGLAVSLSEYEKQGKRVQSLFLRLIPGLIKQLFPVPRDVRGGNRPASQQVLDVVREPIKVPKRTAGPNPLAVDVPLHTTSTCACRDRRSTATSRTSTATLKRRSTLMTRSSSKPYGWILMWARRMPTPR